MEQCVDEDKGLSFDEEFQAKEDTIESPTIDKRTFSEIIMDAFQKFDSKSSQVRTNSLAIIINQLQLSHNPAFLTEHNKTILNIMKKALESDIASEIDGVARVISLAAIQLPHSSRTLQIFQKPLMEQLNNPNLKSSVRSAVCHAIGILTFLYEKNNDKEVFAVMKALKQIFLPKSYDSLFNETNRKHEIPNYEFQVAALETWMFLTTVLPSQVSFLPGPYFSFKSTGNIFMLLHSPYFNIGTACAKAIALILECGLESDKYYLRPQISKIIQNLSYKTNTMKTPWDVSQYLKVS